MTSFTNFKNKKEKSIGMAVSAMFFTITLLLILPKNDISAKSISAYVLGAASNGNSSSSGITIEISGDSDPDPDESPTPTPTDGAKDNPTPTPEANDDIDPSPTPSSNDSEDISPSPTPSSNDSDGTTPTPTAEAKDDTDNSNSKADETPATSKSYSFGKKSITLYTGWKSYLSEIYGGAEEAVITYRSKNPDIAFVDEDGVITPVSVGKTHVYADITVKDKSYTCSIKVNVKEPYSKITATTDAMTCDSTFVFKLERFGHSEPVSWTLSGEGLAEIEALSATDCQLHTIKSGDVIITAECNGESFSQNIHIYEGTGELFIISPSSDPYFANYKKYSTYNKKTKGYYLLRSYLERLNTLKGGVLVLTKGTYSITNTLCIPSNTTIILEDGAKILKTSDTGTTSLNATASLFQTVSYTNASKEGVFKKYNGEHDISIIGKGDATIDLNGIQCQGIVAAHCKNLTISGISFKNMNTYHFIELAGNANVTISGNYFYGFSESKTTRKEAINIDTPDKETHGFSQYWTSYDKTANKNIYITDNVFYNLECGIGTHKYSEGHAHKNVNILRNTFIDSSTYSIRCMNWDNPVIKDNVFTYTVPFEYAEIAIILNGVKDPEVYDNLFDNLQTPISFYHWQNTGYGKSYAPIYNELSQKSMELLQQNTLTNVTNPYFEYYITLGDYSDASLEIHLIEGTS